MAWIIPGGHVSLHELPERTRPCSTATWICQRGLHIPRPCETLAEKARGEIGEIIAPISPHVPFFGLDKLVIYVALI